MKPKHKADESKSQAINLRAVRWAYEQEDLHVTTKAVLMTFAVHANERGYTWPGVDHIASTWRMDRKTVRRQIEQLLASRKIFRTKKRCGYTGQVKVYRLPKTVWGSGGKSTRLQKSKSGDKESYKSPISGGEFPPNNDNDEHHHYQSIALGNSTPSTSSNGKRQSDFVEGYQHQNQPAQDHIKWPEFAAWCRNEGAKRGKGGNPTEDGFWKWLCGQAPQWRNKVRQKFNGEEGYVLNGKFFTNYEANAMAVKNSELITKLQRAIKRGDNFEIVQPR